MLAGELHTSHPLRQGRVLQQTIQLQVLTRDITRLTELGNLLQARDSLWSRSRS